MKNLSTRQFEIMDILWSSDKPMVASHILASDEQLNINTVQSVLRSLIKKNYIELAEIVYSGTVLARSYRPLISKENYLQSLGGNCNMTPDFSSGLAALVAQEKDIKVLEELENLIAEAKEKLKV